MKLSVWAKKQGIHYQTAWNWCNNGTMPVSWERTPSGTILVHDNLPSTPSLKKVYTYARVSSYAKKEDLQRQSARCAAFCENKGLSVEKSFKEIASGMNDNRPILNKVLDLPPGVLVVEHKDRLTLFGFNYLDTLLRKLGWEIVVINRDENDKDDLMKEIVAYAKSL